MSLADSLNKMKSQHDERRRQRPGFRQDVERLHEQVKKAAMKAAALGESSVTVQHYHCEDDEPVAIEAGRRLRADGLRVWFNSWLYSVHWGEPVCGVGAGESSPLNQEPEVVKPKLEVIDGGGDEAPTDADAKDGDSNKKAKNPRFRWLGLW